MSLHWSDRAGWVSVPDDTCAYCDQPPVARTNSPDTPFCATHRERAHTEAEIQHLEDYLREDGHRLFCGEQDGIANRLQSMRENLADGTIA